MTRLESAQNNLGTQIENLSSAKSRISDADLAKEVSDVRKGQILQQYQSSMLNEANNQGAMALKLIG
jgi:flagellin